MRAVLPDHFYCAPRRYFILALSISIVLSLSRAHAQRCSGNIQNGCTNPGAVCSPVRIGTGQTGHCQTPSAEPPGERECNCVGAPIPPAPTFDAGCSDRSAKGKFTCTIFKPNVNQHETEYPNVVFAPEDVVDVFAAGCVQTGGWGSTWKRYVNPAGPDSDKYYHGLVRIPTAIETSGALVRINSVIGKRLHVTGAGVPVNQLDLHLGYEDNDYTDNGYSGHDDGTDGQCKLTDLDPISGGPAFAVITIYRGVPPDAPESNFDFDVLSEYLDPNGLPYNPWWSWQLRPENTDEIPSTSSCHDFSTRDTTLGIPNAFMSPYFSDCTDQADLSTVDLAAADSLCWYRLGTAPYIGSTFAGHVNWFPVTLEGRAEWGDHSDFPYPFGDDDYTFTFVNENDGNPLSVNGRSGLHVEFDSDETIDHFTATDWDGTSTGEWQKLHDAVDASESAKSELASCQNGQVYPPCSNELQTQLQQTMDSPTGLFDGHTILTGMFGLDTEHDLKAELHPLFAMATRRDKVENSPDDEAWLIFVRNQGDEGYCSQSIWDLGLEDYTVHLPWRPGAATVTVNWDKTKFVGTDGTSGPSIAVFAPHNPGDLSDRNTGVYVSFHLGTPVPISFQTDASTPFIYGVLHLRWGQLEAYPVTTLHSGLASHPEIASVSSGRTVATKAVETDEVEQDLASAAKKLTPIQLQQIKKSVAIVRKSPKVHTLQPVKEIRQITEPPAVARIAQPHAIKGGPATDKLGRDAARMRALCEVTHNAPAGLPAQVCKTKPVSHP